METKMNSIKIRSLTTVLSAVCLLFAGTVYADQTESAEIKIARAITAGYAGITDKATILDVDGTVLREGSNGWTCLPGIGLIPGDKHPMCNDEVWMKWMNAAAEGKPFSTDVVGVSYMLAGDALVNNANPAATDPKDGGVWVQEGPHLMLLFPTTDAIASLPRDPFVGGHYVMWDKTPMVHMMIPLAAKPK
jgi:hypothetical protein